MKILKFLLLLPLLLIFVSMPVSAAIRLSTEKFEFNVKPNDNFLTGSFTVQNDGNATVRFRAYPEYFEISENGTILTEIKNKNVNSVSENIRFNPAEFTLNSNDSQKIRFTITNVRNLPDGESRAALFLEDIKTKQQALPTGSNKASANLVIKTRIAIPIYVDKGRVIKVGAIQQVNLEKVKNRYQYDLRVKSSGNSLIRVSGIGQIVKDNNLISEFPINERPVQAGTVGIIKDFIPTQKLIPGQDYTLKVSLSYKGQDNKEVLLRQEMPFNLGDITKKG
ncbi:MAG: hypothetical protein A2104_07855 [Candidatus Melainabacteria bacterium GWF2_32_7]|nr:MAG: hypothetical protein A2104_07855 [Candidatus Melainabacteria bacterium GWF2_32_7]